MLEELLTVVLTELEAVDVGQADRDRMFDPHIGYVPAEAGYLVGDSGTTGALVPYGALVLTAADDRLSIGSVVFVKQPETLVQRDPDLRAVMWVRQEVDRILKRVYWTEEGP
jgi:hypothetical protein